MFVGASRRAGGAIGLIRKGKPERVDSMTASTQQQEVAELAEVFHLMGDPSRLSILMVVLDGPRARAKTAAGA